MKSNVIVAEARVMQVRELKTSLAKARERLVKSESERDLLLAHFSFGLVALHDFERLPSDAEFRIIDGWNAILRMKNVSKLAPEDISELKKQYLRGLGVSDGSVKEGDGLPVGTWIVFDGNTASSYRSGSFRVTYTGGAGAHRADRMIVDFVNAARVLGLDVSRIVVETADKNLAKRVTATGARVA